MAVRFILGRAGSGKTHHCLDAIRERLREDPLDGPRLILLVPEQAALQMERALLDPADASGGPPILVVHRAEVFSFRRLAFRILDTAGPPPAEALSETARAMVLRHIVRRHAASLRYYRSLAGPGTHTGLGGFIERLAASITELLQEAIDPADLAQAARGETPADNDLPRAD
ncbi:MAG: hypothetical protein ACE5EX_11405, partial [Phycisphaerae bacterium]